MDDLSGDTRQIINDRVNSASQMTGDYEQDAKTGLFKDFQPTQYNFGLNAQNDAIANKAKQRFLDPVLSDIQANDRVGYSGRVQGQMQSAQRLAMGQLRYDNARAMAARQRAAQEEAQRAQMIGTLFQVGGTIAGAMAGGGTPQGMALGANIGGQAGRGLSGSQSTNSGYMNTPGRTA